MSLIGGKAAAVEAAGVATEVRGIGTAAEESIPGIIGMTAGLDALRTSSIGVTSEFGAQFAETDALLLSTTRLNADVAALTLNNDRLIASVDASSKSAIVASEDMNVLSASMLRAGYSADAVYKNVALAGKGLLMGFGAVAAGVAFESSKMAVSFSGATASLAANANISVAAAGKIGAAFISLHGTTEYNAQQMTEAYAQVAGQMSTLSGHALTAGQSLAFMTTATKLADASGQDLGVSTSSLSSEMQVYHLQLSQAGWASNILYNTSRLTANSVSALDTVTARLHSRLGQMIPSLSDTSALMLDLAEHGAKGSRGTMVVVSAMNTLLGSSKTVSSMLQVLGLSTQSFVGPDGKFIGMANAIALLQPKLAALPQNLRLLAEQSLFGAGASQLMGQVVLSGASAFDKASKSVNQYGVMNAAADKQIHSVEGSLHVIDAAIHDFMISLGNYLLPKLIAFGRWMLDHKPILIGIGVVIGGLIVTAIGMYVASIIIATTATEFFWGVATAGIAIAAVAIIAGIMWLSDHWSSIWEGIKGITLSAWYFLDNLLHNPFVLMLLGPVGALIYLGQHWKTVWHGIRDVVTAVWDIIKPIFDAVGKGIGLIGKASSIVGGALHGITHLLGFAEGGVVPGPKGAPMVALVHGGEAIVPPHNVYSSSGPAAPSILGMAASRVVPTGGGSTIPAQMIANASGSGGGPTVIQLVVDRKVLAEAVYQQINNDYARR